MEHNVMRGRSGLVWAGLMVACAGMPAAAADLFVPAVFPTVADAVAAAMPGDRVLIAPGSYITTLDAQGKAITIAGAGAAQTIITAPNGAPALRAISGETPATVFSGVSLRRGGPAGLPTSPVVVVTNVAPVIDNCIVTGGFALDGGGALVTGLAGPIFNAVSFTSNTAQRGGAIAVGAGASVSVVDCSLAANVAEEGGAIHATGGANVEVTLGGIVANSAGVAGGAVFVEDAAVTLAGLELMQNTAPLGGGVAARGEGGIVLAGVIAGGNGAGMGGVIHAEGNVTSLVQMSALASNVATRPGVFDGSGGAIHQTGGIVTIENASLTANTADDAGGAVYVEAGSLIVQGESELVGNESRAGVGGAVATLDSVVSISNTRLNLNTSLHDGGALAIDGGDMLCQAVEFTGNTSGLTGGAIRLNGATCTVALATFEANTAPYGGAVNVGFGAGGSFAQCQFIGNTADNQGGAVVAVAGVPVFVGCTFVRNHAGLHAATATGGAVWVTPVPSLELMPAFVACVFNGNTAPLGGGALHLIGGATVTNCAFSGNAATNFASTGGGILVSNLANASIINCTLAGNVADLGPAMYADFTPLDVFEELFPDLEVVSGATSIFNTVARGAGDGRRAIVSESGAIVNAGHSNIEGGLDGDGNIDAPAGFVRAPAVGSDGMWGTEDDDYGDLRPGSFSPLIDAGNNFVVPADTFDIDQDLVTAERLPIDLFAMPRFFDDPMVADTGEGTAPIVDIGAYEFQFASGTMPCGPADIAPPFGTLNFADVQTFLGAFGLGLPDADIAAPIGVLNFADVQVYLGYFGIGCP